MGRFLVRAVDFPQILGEAVDVVGAKNQIHEGIALSDLVDVALLLHHAAADRDLHIGIFLLKVADPAEAPEGALVGVIPDGAGIKDDKIRLLGLDRGKAGLHQDADQLLGISRVHLAAEGDCAGSQLPPCFFGALCDQCAELADIIELPAVFIRGLRTHQVDGCDLFFQFRICIHSYPHAEALRAAGFLVFLFLSFLYLHKPYYKGQTVIPLLCRGRHALSCRSSR